MKLRRGSGQLRLDERVRATTDLWKMQRITVLQCDLGPSLAQRLHENGWYGRYRRPLRRLRRELRAQHRLHRRHGVEVALVHVGLQHDQAAERHVAILAGGRSGHQRNLQKRVVQRAHQREIRDGQRVGSLRSRCGISNANALSTAASTRTLTPYPARSM